MLYLGPNSDLTLNEASKPAGILLLGALTLKQLQVRGSCTFFLNADGIIELANPIEISLDALPEEEAIRSLIEKHQYNDEQLVSYLRGREARSLPGGERGNTHEQDM